MKKLLLLLLAMALLSGCAPKGQEQETTSMQEQTTAATADQGSYQAGHAVEQETNGAVQVFDPQISDISQICMFGNNLLLLSGEENVTLTLLAGNKLTYYASAQTTLNLNSELCSYAATSDGFAYYDAAANEVVYLNVKLQEDSRLKLPEGISGKPFISASGSVYYSIEDQIREVAPDTQIPRMIKKVAGKDLKLLQFAFEGKVLGCAYTDNYEQIRSLYISGETGETLREGDLLLTIDTWGDSYLATRMDGIVKQQIIGALETEAKGLNAEPFAPLLQMNGVLLQQTADAGQVLSVCDLGEGKAISRLTLNASTADLAIAGNDCIWLLVSDAQGGKQLIYRWDSAKTATETEETYTGALYTADNPDTAGLETCQKRVDELNKKYNVKIRIWQDAVKVQENHTLVPEYQIVAITDLLDRIETALSTLPEDFMRKTGDRNTVRICIVRSIDGDQKAVNFWDQDGDVFLAFAADSQFEKDFPLMLGYPVVSHILGNSAKMDYWNDYNPEGFVYGEKEQKPEYLEGKTRAFADSVSMETITDDRSRIFAYGLMPENREIFQSEAMQGKLKLLCESIRETYRLTRYKEQLPWEQYLQTPITPQ